ncbi:hypothetical protein BCO37747_07213 [Burkholderia contaminans]|nr:hypothetical protein SK875_A02286 [Burkholderia contaminans]VWC41616.1 hypothetical protein BCO23253_07151 [Burkholderia contaminans]VWD60165.1 hypothetical protein BCO37747_07213 [Burkholderia contaminans]
MRGSVWNHHARSLQESAIARPRSRSVAADPKPPDSGVLESQPVVRHARPTRAPHQPVRLREASTLRHARHVRYRCLVQLPLDDISRDPSPNLSHCAYRTPSTQCAADRRLGYNSHFQIAPLPKLSGSPATTLAPFLSTVATTSLSSTLSGRLAASHLFPPTSLPITSVRKPCSRLSLRIIHSPGFRDQIKTTDNLFNTSREIVRILEYLPLCSVVFGKPTRR